VARIGRTSESPAQPASRRHLQLAGSPSGAPLSPTRLPLLEPQRTAQAGVRRPARHFPAPDVIRV